jgi:sugar-specific transcriptional regulator TrmB
LPFSEDVTTLKDLGLSTTQARIYRMLTHWDELSIETIAKISRVARTDLYRIIKQLESRGLVERIILNPTKFRAIPVDKGLDLLIQERHDQLQELKKRSEILRQQSRKEIKRRSIRSEKNQFLRFTGNRIKTRIRISIETVQKDVRLVLTLARLLQGLNYFAEIVEKALNRGVEYRVIIERPYEWEVYMNQATTFINEPRFQVKFMEEPPKTIFALYDEKEVYIFQHPEETFKQSTALWSSNASLIAVMNECFETKWKSSAEN